MRFRLDALKRLVHPQIHCSTKRNIQISTSLSIRQNTREFPVGNDFSYEEAVKNFKWDVPEYFNFSKDFIDKFAETEGLV